jgi:hypothetical protein
LRSGPRSAGCTGPRGCRSTRSRGGFIWLGIRFATRCGRRGRPPSRCTVIWRPRRGPCSMARTATARHGAYRTPRSSALRPSSAGWQVCGLQAVARRRSLRHHQWPQMLCPLGAPGARMAAVEADRKRSETKSILTWAGRSVGAAWVTLITLYGAGVRSVVDVISTHLAILRSLGPDGCPEFVQSL